MGTPAEMRVDLVVVGGGPAGSTAARIAAGAGMRVVLLEKARLPRYKTCGGGVVLRASREIGIDLDAVAERRCASVRLVLHDLHRTVTFVRPHPVLFLVMRAVLDARLVEAARRAGAAVHEDCAFTGLESGRAGIKVRAGDRQWVARYVLGADGAGSRVARSAGLSVPRASPALEWEVPAPAGEAVDPAEPARFDFGLVEDGYAWVFPKAGHRSVGVLRTRPGPHGLRPALEAYLRRVGLAIPEAGVSRHGAGIPMRLAPRLTTPEGVWLLGDAAGMVDALTGEGIGPAITSGGAAAAALLEAGDDPARAASAYRDRLEGFLLPELRWSRRLARVVYGAPWARRRLLRALGPQLVEAMGRVITGESSYARLFGNPGSYRAALRDLGRSVAGKWSRRRPGTKEATKEASHGDLRHPA